MRYAPVVTRGAFGLGSSSPVRLSPSAATPARPRHPPQLAERAASAAAGNGALREAHSGGTSAAAIIQTHWPVSQKTPRRRVRVPKLPVSSLIRGKRIAVFCRDGSGRRPFRPRSGEVGAPELLLRWEGESRRWRDDQTAGRRKVPERHSPSLFSCSNKRPRDSNLA